MSCLGVTVTDEEVVARVKSGQCSPLEIWQRLTGLVLAVARRYKGYAEIDDLCQEAYFGVMSAVDLYDANRGIPFRAYAKIWIRQSMQRYAESLGAVRLPSHAAASVQRYKRVLAEFELKTGRRPEAEEICRALQIDFDQLDQLEHDSFMAEIGSLDSPASDEGDATIGDFVRNETDIEADVVDAVTRQELASVIWKAVDKLPERQAAVIRSRYKDGRTFADTASGMGVSVERVRNLEFTALRAMAKDATLYPFLDDYRYSLGLKMRAEAAAMRALRVQKMD